MPDKSVDYEQIIQDTRQAFYAEFRPPATAPQDMGISSVWVERVLNDSVIVEENGKNYQVSYTRNENGEPVFADRSQWVEVERKTVYQTVKAVKETPETWELDVLAVPFGGPFNGKDSDGEFFSTKTNLHLENFSTPLAVYYHGHDENGKPMGEPAIIGTVKGDSWEKKPDGWWVRIVLDKAAAYAKRVWQAAQKSAARASSATAAHLFRKDKKTGEILNWPVVEVSLFDAAGKRQPSNPYAVALPALKSMYDQAGLSLPDYLRERGETETEATDTDVYRAEVDRTPAAATKSKTEVIDMTPDEIAALVASQLKAQKEADAAEAAAQAEIQARIDAAVKAEKDKWEAEQAKTQRLPTPTFTRLGEIGKYDNLSLSELDVTLGAMKAAKMQPSDNLLRAVALRAEADAAKDNSAKTIDGAIKAVGVKANELNYSTYSTYGSDWVGTAYSNQIWDKIRQTAGVVNRIETDTIPDGFSSKYWPLESDDPTWYKVAEATGTDADTDTPLATIPESKMKTGSKQIVLAKLGARSIFTGELTEDSLVRWAPQLQKQLEASGAEILEHAYIDGDDTTTENANINDIAGTPAGTESFMVWDGFRQIALATSGQNRSASGNLTEDDYLETLRLLGSNGIGGLDPTKCAFLVDVNTYYASMKIPTIKTRDVNSAATLEAGRLTRMWATEVLASSQMHRWSANRKTNSAGKIDQDTTANNLYGAILGVRFDQWKAAFKRRMTMEYTRYARSDANEIVAIIRGGLACRDTAAAGITYAVGV
ncbi:MAG: hypothetical protein AAGU05_01135 [Anaerolineaceae bacterium]